MRPLPDIEHTYGCFSSLCRQDWGVDLICSFCSSKVILPMMFYVAPCQVLVSCSRTRLTELNSVVTCATHMAFKLERITSMDASLAIVGIELARYHILQLSVYYIIRWHKKADTLAGSFGHCVGASVSCHILRYLFSLLCSCSQVY